MNRRDMLKWFGAAAVGAAVGVDRAARAADVLKFSTVFPSASPWGQTLKKFADTVKTKTNGNVDIQFTFNGASGDEGAVAELMKADQIDGAWFTGVGLSKIYKPILALQMPGLFKLWAKLDAARDAQKAEFEKGLSDGGFTTLAWGDVGELHVLSKGFAVRTPDDLKGKKPYAWRDDTMAQTFFQTIGGVTPIPLAVQGVLPGLNAATLDVVIAPSLMAEQLQWSGKLDTLVTTGAGRALGGLIVSSKRLATMSDADRTAINAAAKTAGESLRKIRDQDASALGRLKGKMTNTALTADEDTKWEAIYKQVRQRLGQGTFDPALITKLEGYAK